MIVALLLMASSPQSVVPGTDHVFAVELNHFGTDRVRSAYIFRARDGSVIDWRWEHAIPQSEPRRGGRVFFWEDQGLPRVVYASRFYQTRTVKDRELEERKILPHHLRSKLFSKP